jgi:hypothetical protein
MAASVDHSTIESRRPSRRALLVGALGGLGAWAASVIGRASPVRAGVDGDVVLGSESISSTTTRIDNFNSDANVFMAESAADLGFGGGTAIWGISDSNTGVQGNSSSGVGVQGNSSSGVGVQGNSTSQIGVVGLSTNSTGSTFGVFGRSNSSAGAGVGGRGFANRTGVVGYSGGGTFPSAPAKTGVYGYAAQDSSSKGIYGKSPGGYAGYFAGKVYTTTFYELTEIANPSAPGANRARLFIRDKAGTTQLCVRFHNGTIRVLASD